jgi:hypothetical protein
MKIIDTATLQRLEQLHRAASPVPWGVDTDGREVCTFTERYSGGPPFDIMSESFARGGADDDAALIAESRNALPMLLESVRRLKEAFLLAREWIGRDPASAPATYEEDMSRITALVYGNV